MKTTDESPRQGYNIVEEKLRIANADAKTIDMKQLQETIEKARANASK
ncbi:hypothetical protein FHS57_003343 [Runella defluvii]|uniref:Uncharacterized protein n=1 Tax=Runella defluvii TaxID=370973 RepID=A0A7W5ZPI2_9BACT|nr:hypothetical protein [Runella defluvii]MBB3839337.1 hypothetical protein [Runella defluvii]